MQEEEEDHDEEEAEEEEKKWVATDTRDGRDLPLGNSRRHKKTCRYLQPTPTRPHTGRRKATPEELKTQPPCKVC